MWSAYLIKFNSIGEVNWQKTFSSYEVSEEIYDWAGEAIDLTNDGGGIIAIDNGQFGFLRLTNVQNTLGNNLGYASPSFSKLYDNFPNPFNPITNIRYDLPEATNVTISIYNIMGRKVKNLINTNQNSGYKSVIWNGTNNNGEMVSGGMYFYSIKTNTFSQTRKMILLK